MRWVENIPKEPNKCFRGRDHERTMGWEMERYEQERNTKETNSEATRRQNVEIAILKTRLSKVQKNRKKSQDKIMETQNLRTNQVKILKTSRCWKNPASTTKKRKVNEAKTRSRQDCKDGRCDLTRSPYLAATWQWGRVHYSAQQSVQGTGRRWWGGRGSQWWAELTGFPSCPCSAPWSPTCTPCHRVWRWPVWLPYIVSQCLCVHVCVCVRGE